MKNADRLVRLYQETSKHSNYQILPKRLAEKKELQSLIVKSRNEKIRLDYFKSAIDFSSKRVLDIGGNSGYFSIELLDSGAEFVHYYEGNKEHYARTHLQNIFDHSQIVALMMLTFHLPMLYDGLNVHTLDIDNIQRHSAWIPRTTTYLAYPSSLFRETSVVSSLIMSHVTNHGVFVMSIERIKIQEIKLIM